MIEVMPNSHNNILGVKATGKLTDEDYKDIWVPRLEQIIREHGKVRALLYMAEDFQGWDAHAMWDDAKFGTEHYADFEKIAVVGGPKWVKWTTKICGYFIKGQIETFNDEQLQEAWDWIES